MKRWLCFMLSLILTLSLCSCGNSASEKELQSRIEELEKQLAEQSSNGETSEEVTEDSSDNKMPENDGNTSEPEKVQDSFVEVNFGDTITLDFVTITIDDASCTDCLYPTDTSGYYSYYSDKEDEKYWSLIGTMKNTGTEAYSVENIVAELCFDDKYKYTAYLIADDGGDDFYGDYVKPFSSIKYYIYASIPEELINMYSKCTVKFAFKDNFSYAFYDFDECKYSYQITVNK